jgi:hypothetical protein
MAGGTNRASGLRNGRGPSGAAPDGGLGQGHAPLGQGRHHPAAWRGSAIGIYRFWCGLGYAVGALDLGLAASLTGPADAAFRFVALSVFASGAVLYWFGEETHPKLHPAREGATA